ncbi:STAS domain-containing protein [Actimicrobium sp. CCI2.3]|uniref:STAS domain-containing protein n=1 Tax=Actimicrobium sp. CCI2.3 TaxID=3048616 RepID=UPI002AB3C03E|nr:STAS domain-containing protein [Actimicrobium sp. CCI2.3]MDY7572749.1 STAS domain-containing protein [Actimicrobium sp. CCI2.3]MEB0022269.1 STAS domain-containing protein [Actimicrobium sp. CCI2.3]
MTTRHMRIDGELTIYRADEIKSLLMAALAKPGDLELDLSGVSDIDTAGLQLLMLAKKTSLAGATALHLTRHSAAVAEVFELLDLTGYFGDPLVLPHPPQSATTGQPS